MSFVRGMEYGEQMLPTNDLFVYLPVQILPDLVTAMEQQGFKPAEVKGGSGYRPKEEGAENNPLIGWECTPKTLLMIDTPACRPLPGPKELTLVEPLTRLWDKPSRSPPCCNCECALKSPYGETWQQPEIPQPICQQRRLCLRRHRVGRTVASTCSPSAGGNG